MNITSNKNNVPHYGVYELTLPANPENNHPIFTTTFNTTFTRPNGSTVTTEGFYNNHNTFKTRAYADTLGEWQWTTSSNLPDLNTHTGTFTVHPSPLKGQQTIHPQDPYQFAYQNGDWFLHIGDTGYRYVTDTEPEWRAYIDQAAAAGFTKIRTWFSRGRSDVQALFTPDRTTLNLPYWQEIDHRLLYALNHHPHIIFKLIHTFFNDTSLTLVNFTPDDACAGNNPTHIKCTHTDTTYIVYLANPSGNTPETDTAADTTPEVTITLIDNTYTAHWFDPTLGLWHNKTQISGGSQTLTAPNKGDWILLLTTQPL